MGIEYRSETWDDIMQNEKTDEYAIIYAINYLPTYLMFSVPNVFALTNALV